MALAVLSGLTMLLIPAHASNEFVLTTTIKDRDGAVLSTVRKSEGISDWVHVSMVFAMPGHFPTGVQEAMLRDLTRATIDEARRQCDF